MVTVAVAWLPWDILSLGIFYNPALYSYYHKSKCNSIFNYTSIRSVCHFRADVYIWCLFAFQQSLSYNVYFFLNLGDQLQIFTAGGVSAPLEHVEMLLIDGRVLGNHFAQRASHWRQCSQCVSTCLAGFLLTPFASGGFQKYIQNFNESHFCI